MSRSLRIEFPAAVYYITSRRNSRKKIYRDDDDRIEFLAILANIIGRYGWICHAYCLMDDHYHIVIETPKANLSHGMRQLNGVYTQAYNRRHRKAGHLFQGRFKAILVEKEAYLLELCRDVVLNPIRAKRVSHPRKWKWSSYRATAGEVSSPSYLTIHWILGRFGKRLQLTQKRYRIYVAEGRRSPSPLEDVQGQIYLGGGAFIANHRSGRRIREAQRKQTQAHRPELADIFHNNGHREEAILVAYCRYGYRLAEIAEHLGVHYSTISRRLRKAESHKGGKPRHG